MLEHIIRKYHLPSHDIFNLLQDIKDDFEPSFKSHTIAPLLKLQANLNFLASFQRT